MAASHDVTVVWHRDGDFLAGRYSRAHEWHFDGGLTVPGSASPSVVRAPYSREDAVDPEEAFVAAISSCHMLWFLDLAKHAGFLVEAYQDDAKGVMGRQAAGRYWLERVTLSPRIVFAGDAPDEAAMAALHHEAHERCFIANSVKTEIVVEPRIVASLTETGQA